MRIKGAIIILNKRAKFFGKTLDQLIEMYDNGFDDNLNAIVAYEVYKMDQGYVWSGQNNETWVMRENA